MSPAAAVVLGSKARRAWALLLVLASIPPGFVFGAAVGAQVLVPRSAGLAGGAMVLGYGILGVPAAMVGALLLARYLPASRLKFAAVFVAGVALTLLAWLALRFGSWSGAA